MRLLATSSLVSNLRGGYSLHQELSEEAGISVLGGAAERVHQPVWHTDPECHTAVRLHQIWYGICLLTHL